MRDGDAPEAARPTRRLTAVALVVWAVLAFALPLSALTLNIISVAGIPLGFWVAAEGSLIALALLAFAFATRAGASSAKEGWAPGMRFAGESVGSAGFVGIAGLVAALGFDGLALPLGIAAGLALATIIVVPRYVLYPAKTFGGVFTLRYGGAWPRRLALAIAVVGSILLLAADIKGAGLAIQGLTGSSIRFAVLVTAVLLALGWLAGSLAPSRRPHGGVYVFLVLAFVAGLLVLTTSQGRPPLPQFAYGSALQDTAALEQKLFLARLADAPSLHPLSAPFLQLSMMNFAGLVLGAALGLGALPHLLGRHLAFGTVAASDAPRRSARALTLVAFFLIGVTAFAVLARAGLASLLVSGVKTAALPEAIVKASGLGWVDVCGAQSFSAADLAAACAKLSGQKGLLRLQDITFLGDAYLFAASSILGVPALLWTGLLVGGLAAAWVSGHAILNGISAAVCDGRNASVGSGQAGLEPRAALVATLLLSASLGTAACSAMSIPALVSEGLALIASGLFPALVLGLYWPRMGATGAIAAMVAGFAVAAMYIAGVRIFPELMFDMTGQLSVAAPSAVRKFSELKAALAAAQDDVARDAARAKLTAFMHAQPIANWWGLKPGAVALLGVPAGVIAAVLATLLRGRADAGR
jgi:cation/acetate symporter